MDAASHRQVTLFPVAHVNAAVRAEEEERRTANKEVPVKKINMNE